MTYKDKNIEQIIDLLNEIEIDGETMEYIIRQVGMEDQMLRQLVMSSPIEQLNSLIEERKDIWKSRY
jgi:hypothetical protein